MTVPSIISAVDNHVIWGMSGKHQGHIHTSKKAVAELCRQFEFSADRLSENAKTIKITLFAEIWYCNFALILFSHCSSSEEEETNDPQYTNFHRKINFIVKIYTHPQIFWDWCMDFTWCPIDLTGTSMTNSATLSLRSFRWFINYPQAFVSEQTIS